MRIFTFILINLTLATSLSSQSFTAKNGQKHLWGTVNIEQLTSGDYEEWYNKNLEDFQTSLTEEDGTFLEDVKVKIFLGTWCGDTKYLVPKFIKCWESMGLDKANLELIGVHNKGDLYKQGPNNETRGYNIHKVPTFIFNKKNKEIGRIVERTVFDLDTDIKAIAKGENYEERYQAVSILNTYFAEVDMDSLFTKNSINKAYKMIRREVSTSSELNAYGYVLMAEKKFEQSEFVLKLNRHLFSYNPNTRDSYGEILFKNGKLEEAKEEYIEALRLKQDNTNAIANLAEINVELEKEKEKDLAEAKNKAKE